MGLIETVVYCIVAIVGFVLYSLSNWAATNEPFNGKKFFVSIMTGLLGVLGGVVVLQNVPITIESILVALTPAAGASATLNALQKLNNKTEVEASQPTDSTSQPPS